MKKYLIFILLSFIAVFFLMKVLDDKDKKELKDYPILRKMYSQSISGKVLLTKKTMNKYSKGLFLVGVNSVKFSLNRDTSNKEYTPSNIETFLQLNDSIYKPAFSDSIYIHRDGKRYFFISGINL